MTAGRRCTAHAVVLAEAQQPLLPSRLASTYAPATSLRLVAQQPGVLRALQQRDLGGGVAGGDGADLARLDHGDAASGPGQQQSRGETGDPGAHDDLVDRPLGKGVVGQGSGAVEPEGSHRRTVPEQAGAHASR